MTPVGATVAAADTNATAGGSEAGGAEVKDTDAGE